MRREGRRCWGAVSLEHTPSVRAFQYDYLPPPPHNSPLNLLLVEVRSPANPSSLAPGVPCKTGVFKSCCSLSEEQRTQSQTAGPTEWPGMRARLYIHVSESEASVHVTGGYLYTEIQGTEGSRACSATSSRPAGYCFLPVHLCSAEGT